MVRSFALLALLALSSFGCAPSAPHVSVQLVTDYVPGRDFDAIQVGLPGHTETVAAVLDRSYGRPVRVAEIEVSSLDRLTVTVALTGGARVVQAQPRRVSPIAGGTVVVTFLITRDCDGVICPGAAEPDAIACVGGRCVSPDCSAEHPERCPACGGGCPASAVSCVENACRPEGVCFAAPRDELCAMGQICDSTLGCRTPATPAPDASMLVDASADASSDAAIDGADAPASLAVLSVEPAFLPPEGGELLVALGGDLGGLAVTLDGAACAPIAMTDATHLRCTAPAHAPALVTLSATNAGGAVAQLPGGLAYVARGPYQIGGPADDRTSGVAIDLAGNVYLSGATMGALGGAGAGDYDALLVKYDVTGRLAWTRQLGTSAVDYARDVAIDQATGDVVIVGHGAGDIDGDGATFGATDIFVARYSSAGDLRWARQVGTAGNDEAWDVAVDAAGNTYVAGHTDDAFAGFVNAGGLDYVVAQLARDGTLQWVQQFGTAQNDHANSVTVTPGGVAYVVGYTLGDLEPTVTNAGLQDLFVARYESDGTRTWIRQRGTAGDERAQDVTLDAMGRPWLSGYTTGALDGETNAGGTDVFAMRFSTAGAWELTRVRGSAGAEDSFGVTVDHAGRVVVSCNTSTTFDGEAIVGGGDFCAVAWASDGTHVYTRIGGSSGADAASSIATAPNGLVYLSLITDGALDGMPPRGMSDVAVAILEPSGIAFQ